MVRHPGNSLLRQRDKRDVWRPEVELFRASLALKSRGLEDQHYWPYVSNLHYALRYIASDAQVEEIPPTQQKHTSRTLHFTLQGERHRGGDMKYFHKVTACLALASTSTPVMAKEKVLIQAVQTGGESVRYFKGTPTLDLEQAYGAVQVTPYTIDHGSLVFTLAIYNNGSQPVNFGLENVRAEVVGTPISLLTVDQLIAKAESRARWSQIGLALLGGLAAGAAVSQRSTYHSTTYTPYGTYRTWASYSNPYAAQNAAIIAGGTGLAINAVQNQLDRTREALGENVIQLTTVDPGDSFAGKIVLAKLKDKRLPQRVRIIATMNGEEYPFEFQVARPGTPTPPFTAITYAEREERPIQPPAMLPQPISQPAVHPFTPKAETAAAVASRPALTPAVYRGGGVQKIPATTPSGYCLQVPPDYRGTGSLSRPVVTDAMPRCSS